MERNRKLLLWKRCPWLRRWTIVQQFWLQQIHKFELLPKWLNEWRFKFFLHKPKLSWTNSELVWCYYYLSQSIKFTKFFHNFSHLLENTYNVSLLTSYKCLSFTSWHSHKVKCFISTAIFIPVPLSVLTSFFKFIQKIIMFCNMRHRNTFGC